MLDEVALQKQCFNLCLPSERPSIQSYLDPGVGVSSLTDIEHNPEASEAFWQGFHLLPDKTGRPFQFLLLLLAHHLS